MTTRTSTDYMDFDAGGRFVALASLGASALPPTSSNAADDICMVWLLDAKLERC